MPTELYVPLSAFPDCLDMALERIGIVATGLEDGIGICEGLECRRLKMCNNRNMQQAKQREQVKARLWIRCIKVREIGAHGSS